MCTKTRNLSAGGGNMEQIRLALQAWCIAGRGLSHRKGEHGQLEPESLPPVGAYTIAQLESALPPGGPSHESQ
eukprot:9440421-Pyramimonas_sp.AAC.1